MIMASSISRKRLIGIASIEFLIGLVAKLPAATALNWFLPADIETRGISGTLCQCKMDALKVKGTAIGPLAWARKPAALITGRLAADIEAGLPGGFFDGHVSAGRDVLELNDARVAVTLAPITRLSPIGPSEGLLQATIVTARFETMWPVAVDGNVILRDLVYPPVGRTPLGSFSLDFDPAMERPADYAVSGQLSSLEGPFDLDGELFLGDQRAYSLRAEIAAKADADQAIRNALRLLGPADASGKQRLVFDGNL